MRFTDLRPTSVYDTYWEFAVKRQNIFFNRMENKIFPWTDDEILKKFKFTNAYSGELSACRNHSVGV